MSEKKFKFVSPGIFINEIDNSQLPAVRGPMGPVIIGRTERGPSLRPVTVSSFSEFVEVFGNPIAGGRSGDVWRDGNHTAPTYAAYAAQAWLKNNSPATIIRLLGKEHDDRLSTGRAGWQTENDNATPSIPHSSETSNGGAYGLFVIEGTARPAGNHPTGALGAIFYLNQGQMILTGSSPTDGGAVGGTGVWVKSVDSGLSFKMEITGASHSANDTGTKTFTFNFNETSPRYIRKVFNTNPTLTNSYVNAEDPVENYWLGESYAGHLKEYASGSVTGESYACLLPLSSGSIYGSDLRKSTQSSKTGWFISQDLGSDHETYDPANMDKLFRFHSLDTGEWDQKNIKISITDIKAATHQENAHGTFTVLVRRMDDTDTAVRVIERFSQCNLNPHSDNYIAKKIGDKYLEWNEGERRYIEYGNYYNKSRFIRVQMDDAVIKGNANSEFLPFGVHGPLQFEGFSFSGSYGPYVQHTPGSGDRATTFVSSSFTSAGGFGSGVWRFNQNDEGVRILAPTGSSETGEGGEELDTLLLGAIEFPTIKLRTDSRKPTVASSTKAYWGADTTYNSSRFNKSTVDVLRAKPYGIDDFTPASSGLTKYSWIFSLDNLKLEDQEADTTAGAATSSFAAYSATARTDGLSITAVSGAYTTPSWKNVLSKGYDRYTTVLHGGFDGVDVTEREPFRNSILDVSETNEVNSYEYNSVKMAMDAVSDPEVAEFDTMLCPGMTNSSLNSHMMKICEDRGDALAIVDVAGGYRPDTESTDSEAARLGSVDDTVSNLLDYGWNTSYACAYYPWVQIRDNINGSTLWCPPSVAALGTMSFGQKSSELWFAPAGFTRGGLSDGAAGIPVVGVRQRLTSKERDKLYEANVNPIATFPAEGIVIFGQKTLQVTPSALDRINVRRLLIYLKKQVSRMAATILFDQNVKVTWNRFRSEVEPFLRSVQSRLGLTDWRVILDESTTTPDLIDRNIMYAKIFLKPAQAIEFIALDFVITNSGASFED